MVVVPLHVISMVFAKIHAEAAAEDRAAEDRAAEDRAAEDHAAEDHAAEDLAVEDVDRRRTIPAIFVHIKRLITITKSKFRFFLSYHPHLTI